MGRREEGKSGEGVPAIHPVWIGKTIWTEVRGQAILGEEEFGDKLVDHLRKHKEIPEIPKSQRYANRPTLAKIFTDKMIRDKLQRDKKIAEAGEKHLYSQREIAAHLGLHYTSVSRIVRYVLTGK